MVMDLKEVKKHISLEKPHIIPELSKEELAGWVQALFFQDQTNEPEEVETYILKKEIAFQAIKTILNGSEPRSVTVKNEKDWIRYFDLENRIQSEVDEKHSNNTAHTPPNRKNFHTNTDG